MADDQGPCLMHCYETGRRGQQVALWITGTLLFQTNAEQARNWPARPALSLWCHFILMRRRRRLTAALQECQLEHNRRTLSGLPAPPQ